MGVDQPSGGMSPLNNNFLPQAPDISRGSSFLQDSSSASSRPASNAGAQITAVGNELAQGLARWKAVQEKNQAYQRQVTKANLSTQTELELKQAYSLHKQQYDGDPADYTKSFNNDVVKPYISAKTQGMKDPKLVDSYGIFANKLSANLTLTAMDDENRLYGAKFTQGIKDLQASSDELLRFSPTPETLGTVLERMRGQYSSVAERLKAFGGEGAAQAELDKVGAQLTTSMILSNAKTGTPEGIVAARSYLANPEVNKYIPDPLHQQNISEEIDRIANHVNDGLKIQVEPLMQSLTTAAVSGKDPSEILTRLKYLHDNGVLDENKFNQVQITQEMAPQYQQLGSRLLGMTDSQLDLALRSMDPAAPNSPYAADQFLADRKEIHDKFAASLRERKSAIALDPAGEMSSVTGSSDPGTVRSQLIASQLAAGKSIKDIDILGKVRAEKIGGDLETAMATGNMQGVKQIWDGMVQELGSQVVQGDTTMLDIATAELGRTSHAPLAKRALAALMLMPPDKPLDNNSIIFKAAMMTSEQRAKALAAIGYEPGEINKLGKELWDGSEAWRLYFGTEQNSGKADALLASQRGVLIDAYLMTRSSGNYHDTGAFGTRKEDAGWLGGVSGVFGASSKEWALSDFVKQTLRTSVLTVGGQYSEQGPTLGYSAAPVAGAGFQAPTKLAGKIKINASKLALPLEFDGKIGNNDVARSVEKVLGNPQTFAGNVGSARIKAGPQDVRTEWLPTATKPRVEQWLPQIKVASAKYGVPAALAMAVMHNESGGNKHALGAAQDSGLFQVIPSTFAGQQQKHGIKGDIMNPQSNIEAGVSYLADAMRSNQEDVRKVLINYNGGPRAVQIARTPDSQLTPAQLQVKRKVTSYADRVMSLYEKYKGQDAPAVQTSQKYLDYVHKQVASGVTLKPTPDHSGFNMYVSGGAGQDVAILDNNLRPLKITWRQVQSDRSTPIILGKRK
jgi:soluble lytic murein transglycosylase-like protein